MQQSWDVLGLLQVLAARKKNISTIRGGWFWAFLLSSRATVDSRRYMLLVLLVASALFTGHGAKRKIMVEICWQQWL